MELHATQRLGMPQEWDAYNKDAVARFDMHRGKLGNLFDTQQYSRQHPSVRLFTAGEAPAIALINDLGGKEPPTGEITDWKRNMRDLGMGSG